MVGAAPQVLQLARKTYLRIRYDLDRYHDHECQCERCLAIASVNVLALHIVM